MGLFGVLVQFVEFFAHGAWSLVPRCSPLEAAARPPRLRRPAGSGGGRRRFAGGAVALLVLLAAAAGARIVATDLLAANHLLGFLHRARASHPHLLLFAPLAPLVLPVQLFLFVGGLEQEEPAQGFVFDAVHHGF